MTKSPKTKNAASATMATSGKPSVVMEAEVARRVRQHGRSSMKAEVCGVLIGSEDGRTTIVEACIPGVNAAQGGAHVTFTQDTWEHIYKIKDQKYPDARIVGWYHSHPGFGVFLSDHDMFIHENFFSSPQQIAWVYDPHSDEEGCFGWLNKKIEKLDDVAFQFLAPRGDVKEDPEVDQSDEVEAPGEERSAARPASWIDIAFNATTYVFAFVLGAGLVYLWAAPQLAAFHQLVDQLNEVQALIQQRMMQQQQQPETGFGSGTINLFPPGMQNQDERSAGQKKEGIEKQLKEGQDGSKR